MKYLSVCSGIEAATVAWHPLGWQPIAFAEIAKFPSQVLAYHYANVPNRGDFTEIQKGDYDAIDLLVGGTPCQDFSVAGLRAGMDGARGQLTVEFAHLAGRLRPRWLVWENVPGVLSIDEGRAFGTFIGLLGKLGYGIAYRVLDAQHFGVPQRRRRVFVVGYLGDWRRAAAVLFERHSLSGYSAPRRETGQGFTHGLAPSLTGSGSGRGTERTGESRGQDPVVAVIVPPLTGNPYGDHESREGLLVTHALRGEGFDASEDGTGRGTPLVPVAIQSVNTPREKRQNGIGVNEDGVMYSLTARNQHAIAFTCKDHGADAGRLSPTLRAMGHKSSSPNGGGQVAVAFSNRGKDSSHTAETLRAGCHGALPMVGSGMAVRRLTPRECERLQGFPDDYTLISSKTADGPRYKALGNSMAVPVMRWLGECIQMVDQLPSPSL